MHAQSLSVVGTAMPSNRFKKYDKDSVPNIAPIKNFFPFLKIDNINNGILRINTTVPTGIFSK